MLKADFEQDWNAQWHTIWTACARPTVVLARKVLTVRLGFIIKLNSLHFDLGPFASLRLNSIQFVH